MNLDFKEPPKTDLPSADAFTRLETPINEEFYIGSGDLANAFYTLSVPPDLAERFILPSSRPRCFVPALYMLCLTSRSCLWGGHGHFTFVRW
jgi:hypothetical protein